MALIAPGDEVFEANFQTFSGGDTNPLCGSGSPIPPPPLACMAFGGARGDAPSPNWDPPDHGFYPLNSYGAPLCPSKNKRCRTGSAAGRFGRESIRPQDYSSANQFGRHRIEFITRATLYYSAGNSDRNVSARLSVRLSTYRTRVVCLSRVVILCQNEES